MTTFSLLIAAADVKEREDISYAESQRNAAERTPSPRVLASGSLIPHLGTKV